MSRNRIYGLTVRQWTVLFGIVIAVAVLGCRFCYNVVREGVSPANSNVAVVENSNRVGKRQPPQTPPSSTLSVEQATELYLRLGNPSQANNSDPNNFLMVNPYFALSYNRTRATANWVSWMVTRMDIGNVERANDFRPDDRVPKEWARVTPTDYTGSGFDRGHLCPSKDRSNNPDANSATFLMTNIVPQTPDSNQGVWKILEDYTRSLVEQGNNVYIIAGVAGERGKLKKKVTIPATMWKVVVVLPEDTVNASQVNTNARVIAVDIPNTNGIRNDDWRRYRTSVRQIEQKIGLNLLSNLPQNVQDALETKIDNK